MRKFRGVLLAGLGLVLSSAPVLAHHAFSSEFDGDKKVTVTGVLTKVEWINPHAYWYVDVKDQSGKVTPWTVQAWPPAALRRAGLERDMLKLGEVVVVEGFAAKDGKELMFGQRLQFADGHAIIFSHTPENSKEPVSPTK